jgi:excisionase family DNA binding protein
MTTLLEMPAFTLREAAKYLEVERDTVYRWVREGKLQAEVDLCGQLRIPYGELYSAMIDKEEIKM